MILPVLIYRNGVHQNEGVVHCPSLAIGAPSGIVSIVRGDVSQSLLLESVLNAIVRVAWTHAD